MLDTLRLVQDLEAAGMERRQSEKIAVALNDALKEPIAARLDEMDTRFDRVEARLDKIGSDVAELKRDVAALELDVAELKSFVKQLHSDVNKLKSDVRILKWGNGLVLGGIVAIVIKLFLAYRIQSATTSGIVKICERTRFANTPPSRNSSL